MARDLNPVAKDDVEEDCKIVASTACYDEDVPYRVAERKAAGGKEGDADGIEEASCEEPVDAVSRDRREQWLHRYQGDPAHGEVYGGGQDLEVINEPEFEDDSCHRESPDNREERPAPAAAKGDKRERRVGASDEQIDCAVIEDLQSALRARRRQGVIERRSGVNANESASVYRAADDLQSAAAQNGEHQQHDETGDAEKQADSVRNAVGQFFDLCCGASGAHFDARFHSSLLRRPAQ